MIYCDAHCHLMPPDVFIRAYDKGLRSFCVNTTRVSEWERVIALKEKVLGIYPCFGIHPWYVNEAPPDWAFQLKEMLRRYPEAMVGEIGLDKTKPYFQKQMEVFEQSLQIASETNRRVHIHCVKAWPELFEILGQYRDISPLFHRFSGDEVIVQKLRLFNAYFSVLNGRMTDIIPDNRLLFESDAPDGLRDPANIPEALQNAGIDANYVYQNWELFMHD